MKSHVSLFAGIGALDIAAEHAGYTTTHCVEIDPWCRSVLALRFPGAELHDDVRTVGAAELGTGMDLLSGGFPCQDLSVAGKGAGLDGGRSGLWFEYLRIIGECRPKMVLIENVAVLKSRGLDIVIAGLAAKGYGCWWDCVPALAIGAPHLRDRVWITAVPFDAMPPLYELDPVPFKRRRIAPTGKMPRAGYCTVRGHQTYVYELAPQATIKAAKLAMGAVRCVDGVTWLTSIGSPLLRCNSLPLNAAGTSPCFPTPTVGDSRNSRNATANRAHGGNHHAGTTLSDFTRLWPTATAHPRTHTPRPVHHGRQLANEVFAEERLWPTPSRADGTGGPGRSPARTGGDNLRTAAAPGSLNPSWVEWLIGLPIGWTSLYCSSPVQLDFRYGEPDIPRVAVGVVERKQRLMACGNAPVWQVAATRLDQAAKLLGAT